MAKLPPAIVKIAENEIQAAAANGETPIDPIAARAWLKAEPHLPQSWYHVVGREIMRAEVKRLMKRRLPMNAVIELVPNVPHDVRPIISGMPAWVAVEDGPKARWMPATKCTPKQWQSVARMRSKKRDEVGRTANFAATFAEFLEAMGANCLDDLRAL